ncbi:hypothetical protein [Pseudoduganella violacea]|uniref:DUF3995 domain-containing protein n=1 Tax=Pseudoduganella violacea TaxID=1715466 RepID=A0A7W5BBE2_9BURK|nr:hypothetical protein [Pseudoduganella violacea]MBB3120013.1 hypothetical protein [Pseudoduganella violacea]
MADYNVALLLGAALSALAALLHLGIILGGPSWYRFFGAGERMATMAQQGKLYPTLLTLGIAAVLAAWAAYALSGAGLLAPLPWLKTGLCVIAAVYLLRGLAIVPLLTIARSKSTPFLVWSSLICLGYGIVHAIGLQQIWSAL